jgi:coenzyme F420-reducing hydrogenase beta subunit
MLYFTKNKSDCTGCSCCVSSCPINCISMIQDEEGFLYPVASDKCIKCGKCENICPVNNFTKGTKTTFIQTAYCAISKNKSLWKQSTSGGAFSEICKAFGNSDTIVCGAAWDGYNVHHICVDGVDKISPLCKSKYIASSLDNTFFEIKQYLERGKKAIFCGTPCQVAGLKNYIGKDCDNLLLIDLICHGVGSPYVFKACLEEMENQFNCSIEMYEFRAKRKFYETDYLSRINTDKGVEKYLLNDQYNQLFLKQNCLRPSCGEHCRYRNEQRQGDITIADFKNLTEVFPDLIGTKWNYSSIVVNTAKGNKIMEKLKETMEVRECKIDYIKKHNPLFYRQTWFSKDRDRFFKEFISSPNEAIRKWTSPAIISKISFKRRIYDMLPVFMRRIILKRMRKRTP